MNLEEYAKICPTIWADILPEHQSLSYQIRPIYPFKKRVAGIALPVKCSPDDISMVHKTIYEANDQSIIMVETNSNKHAVIGGNVARLISELMIKGIVIDGLVRDLKEIEESGLCVFAKGNIPVAGKRKKLIDDVLSINCGGVIVNKGDIVVADFEGIVVIPFDKKNDYLKMAQEHNSKDQKTSFRDWKVKHKLMIQSLKSTKHD